MVATPSWPGSSGPSVVARACGDGPDEPGHDAEATGGPILTPMRLAPAIRASADGIQHHDWDLPATCLDLVVGIGREECHRLLPQPRPLLARGGPGLRAHLLGAHLDVDVWIGQDIAVPAR